MSILVLNAGSSTLKFALFDEEAAIELARGMVDWQGQSKQAKLSLSSEFSGTKCSTTELENYGDAVAWVLRTFIENGFKERIAVVGHRVVHGGTAFHETMLIDDQVNRTLQSISKLAPLHHPPVLLTFEATRFALPDVPQVAVFDTAYFCNLPERAFIYPVPYDWYQKYGIRRFGFHGISHSYCANHATELLGRINDDSLRLVICHLGSGCSATAVRGGQPVTTTMGFTPLEGLMMGTRSGSIDPGILIYLNQEFGFNAVQFQETLNRSSGLLGVSGVSSDFRAVEQAADDGNPRAKLAIEMFADRIRSSIGSLAVTLGGIDALIFTAGIGENSVSLRARVCDGLQCLGLQLDDQANQAGRRDCNLATESSTGKIFSIRTREEQMVALETRRLLKLHPA